MANRYHYLFRREALSECSLHQRANSKYKEKTTINQIPVNMSTVAEVGRRPKGAPIPSHTFSSVLILHDQVLFQSIIYRIPGCTTPPEAVSGQQAACHRCSPSSIAQPMLQPWYPQTHFDPMALSYLATSLSLSQSFHQVDQHSCCGHQFRCPSPSETYSPQRSSPSVQCVPI